MDETVRAQYEAYPYPARDPADEAKRLVTGSPSHLLEIEHYVRAGRPAGDLNCLVAGGGTGDGAIMLAQQLADRGAGRVLYLDLSGASMAIARARAETRGLDNIAFRHGSLLDLPALGLGPFDYIDCCGVLHHLEDPATGLAALVSVLAPGGGLGLMLYGALGRTGVYPLQRALRRLSAEEDAAARIGLARRLLDELPPSNWFRRNALLGDHLSGGDAGLYDLLLHSIDRALTVPEIAALADGAGLEITGFVPPASYDPALLLKDRALQARAAALPMLERAALAEELAGTHKTHVFYAVRRGDPAAGCAMPALAGAVPVLRETDAAVLAAGLRRNRRLKADLGGIAVRFDLPEGAAGIVALCDGRRDLKAIHAALRAAQPALDWFAFRSLFDRVYAILNGLNLLLLRRP